MRLPRRTRAQRVADAIVDLAKVAVGLALGVVVTATFAYFLFCAIRWT